MTVLITCGFKLLKSFYVQVFCPRWRIIGFLILIFYLVYVKKDSRVKLQARRSAHPTRPDTYKKIGAIY
jgi:hypothetical protein